MSQPNLPGDQDPTGALRVPSPDPAGEIEAEIADHLATAAERLEQQGLAADAAKRRAEENFGDPAAISRRCFWIKQGDTVMFRSAVIGLLLMLCVALGMTALASWRSQAQMADQMTALAAQLKSLAERRPRPRRRPWRLPARSIWDRTISRRPIRK